ncbi:MAG: hypothetical protein NT061_02410 [Spirochaetes bacterium]|nr:hypothetical protein [Spirochaetota bacterium]
MKLGRFWKLLMLLIVSCIFLVGLAWQASRFADLDSEARTLETAQETWIAENRKIEAEIALLSSRERTTKMAAKLGLKRALPEERLRIQFTASKGASHD